MNPFRIRLLLRKRRFNRHVQLQDRLLFNRLGRLRKLIWHDRFPK